MLSVDANSLDLSLNKTCIWFTLANNTILQNWENKYQYENPYMLELEQRISLNKYIYFP